MTSKRTILVVDDEADLVETVEHRLSSAGYSVVTASDGITCIEKAGEVMPDLILLDIMMPGIDGFETLKRLKAEKKTRSIPVVVISCGNEEEMWARKTLQLGGSGYIVKPFETDALLFTVDKFIKR